VHGRSRYPRFSKIGLEEIHSTGSEVLTNIAQLSAREVVDDSDLLDSSRDQMIRKG